MCSSDLLELGYYQHGAMPLSFFASVDVNGLSARPIKSGTENTPSYATVSVVSGTTTTNHEWLSSNQAITYNDAILARTWNASLRALTRVGPAVTGLYFFMDVDNSAADAFAANNAFRSIVATTNDNTAVLGAVPVVQLDYTVTTELDNLTAPVAAGSSGLYVRPVSVYVGVPFAMMTGNLEHRATLGLRMVTSDQSGAYSIVNSARALNVGGAAVDDETLTITDRDTTTTVSLDYGLRLPAGGEGNVWIAGLSLGVDIDSSEYAFEDTITPYDLSVLAAKTAVDGGSRDSLTETFAAAVDFSAGLSGSRLFSFNPLPELQFRFSPGASFNFSLAGDPQLTNTVSQSPTYLADGTIDPAIAYNRITTTYSGEGASTTTVTLGAALPMGLVFQPREWKFGFLAGATPQFSSTITSYTSSAETAVETTDTILATVTTATVINTTLPSSTTTASVSYNLSESHYIGIFLPLENGVRFEAILNGNLLSFESFTIQAIIPLAPAR